MTDLSHSSISFSSMPISSRSSSQIALNPLLCIVGCVVLSEKLAIPFLPRCPPLWVWEVLSTFLWSPVWLGFLDLLCSRLLSLGGKLSIPVLYLPSILLTLLEFVGKEKLLYDLPRGITCVAETHLASPSMSASCSAFRHFAHQDNRSLRLLPGAAVPLRPRSSVTGVWSGVMQLSDLPCHRLQLHWPQDEFKLGRVQTASFRYGDLSIFGAIIYGWSPGPTWPKAPSSHTWTSSTSYPRGDSRFQWLSLHLWGL